MVDYGLGWIVRHDWGLGPWLCTRCLPGRALFAGPWRRSTNPSSHHSWPTLIQSEPSHWTVDPAQHGSLSSLISQRRRGIGSARRNEFSAGGPPRSRIGAKDSTESLGPAQERRFGGTPFFSSRVQNGAIRFSGSSAACRPDRLSESSDVQELFNNCVAGNARIR